MDSTGLDSIVLSGELCARWYDQGIVNLQKRRSIPHKGRNLQQVLIAVDIYGDMKEGDETLLTNLMTACHLTMDDVALINVREQELPLSEIITHFKSRKILFFGVPDLSIDLPLTGAEEKVIIYDNRHFIKTAPLAALQNNTQKKKALWSALKDMFDI